MKVLVILYTQKRIMSAEISENFLKTLTNYYHRGVWSSKGRLGLLHESAL